LELEIYNLEFFYKGGELKIWYQCIASNAELKEM